VDTANREIEIAIPDVEIVNDPSSPVPNRFVTSAPGNSPIIKPVVPAGTNATPELPPLPDLIPPSQTNIPTLTPKLAATENSLSDNSTSGVDLVGTKIEPPVAAFAGAQNSDPTSNLGPFAEPVVVEHVNIEATPDIAASKMDTTTDESLGVTPPVENSVDPNTPQDNSVESASFERVWAEVQQHLSENDLPKALQTLTPWCSEPELTKDQESRCMQLLDQLAGTVIYSRESYVESAHVVQAGETLEEIATKYAVPQEMLAKINGMAPPYALTTGERIKVMRGPFRATVSLFKSELTLFIGSLYAGRFPVTIGRDLPPEPAFYDVAEKSNGRNYFDRRMGREVLRSEEGNRYGDHWLGLRGEHITTGHSVGIHGRPLEFSASDIGSISLDPIDAEDVYSILSEGSRIEIRP
jgi:hypothetical protein